MSFLIYLLHETGKMQGRPFEIQKFVHAWGNNTLTSPMPTTTTSAHPSINSNSFTIETQQHHKNKMGVPFEALLPYGVMLVVSFNCLSFIWIEILSNNRCLASPEQVWQHSIYTRTMESQEGTQWINGIGWVFLQNNWHEEFRANSIRSKVWNPPTFRIANETKTN